MLGRPINNETCNKNDLISNWVLSNFSKTEKEEWLKIN